MVDLQFWKYDGKTFDVASDGFKISAETINEATQVAITALFPEINDGEVSLLIRQSDWVEGRYIAVVYQRQWHRVKTRDINL